MSSVSWEMLLMNSRPLPAAVRSTIQVLAMRSRSTAEYTQGLDRLLEDNQRVEDLVSRMLMLARMEQPNEPEYRCE